jgi:hypothetical protein
MKAPLVVVIGEQEGAEEGSGPFRVRPSGDDEFRANEAFAFDPCAAIVRKIFAIAALGDDAFEVVPAGGAAEGHALDAGGLESAASRCFPSMSGSPVMSAPSRSRRSKAK